MFAFEKIADGREGKFSKLHLFNLNFLKSPFSFGIGNYNFGKVILISEKVILNSEKVKYIILV